MFPIVIIIFIIISFFLVSFIISICDPDTVQVWVFEDE